MAEKIYLDGEGEDSGLRSHLVIFPPDEGRLVETLAFGRTCEVTISWEDLFDEDGPLEPTEGTDSLREFLERLWGIDSEAPGYPTAEDLLAAKNTRIAFSAATTVIEIQATGQRYHISARSSQPFAADDFDTAEKYSAFWEEKVEDVRVPSGAESVIEELDLSAPIILKQYKELDNLRVAADILDGKANSFFEQQVTQLLSKEELDELISKYQSMKNPRDVVASKLLRLKDRAADLGYVLNVTGQDIIYRYPDNDKLTIKPGELYRPYRTVVSWLVRHRRRVVITRRFLFWKRRYVRYIPYLRRHFKVVRKYTRQVVDLDPWVEKERELQQQGKRSFRFEKRGEQYVTQDGTELQDVLFQCERSRDFWDKCVVWIPVYEQSLTEGAALVRYILISRPMTGVETVGLPALYVQEDASLKAKSRTRVEVGPLIHTINLAPGEERTVTVERTTSREQESTRTATSLIDLVEKTSTDFATELENEARAEKEKTRSSNWNVSASGGFGPFSASAGGGGSSSMTSKQFSRQLHRMARKASRSVVTKTREEVSVSSSVKTSVTSKESTSIDVKNANDGRTLNLAFYQLYNIHKVGMYIEGLRFVIFTGVEDIAGSGIVLPKTFSLEELREMLDQLALGALPARERGASTDDQRIRKRLGYLRQVLLDLVAVFEEYHEGPVTIGTLPNIKQALEDFDPDAAGAPEEFDEIIDSLQGALTDIVYEDDAVGPDGVEDLVVGTAGLYVDAFVGARPSTEPYAEDMRRREVAFRDAEISELLSRADAHRALSVGAVPPRLELESVDSDGDTKLDIEFRSSPRLGFWELWVETHNTGKTIEVTDPSEKEYQFVFAETQAWLTADKKNLCRLVHRVTREAIHFLV